ncbi:hypothetical protein H5410_003137, partial [Solanum commersonii]
MHRQSRLTASSDLSHCKYDFILVFLACSRERIELKRVNPRLFPTHSAPESEWAKAEIVLKISNSVFERNQVDS